MNASTSSLPINALGNPSTIRVVYQHDLDRGMTAYAVVDFKTGTMFERELPTPEFLSLMQDIASRCRVEVVRQ